MNPFREKSRESFARRLRISVLLPTTSSTRTLKHAMPQRVHANNTSSPIRLHSQRIKVATAHFHLAALPRRPSLHGIITPTHRSAQGFLCFSRPFASAHFRPSAAMSSREDAHHYVRWSVRLHRALRGRQAVRCMRVHRSQPLGAHDAQLGYRERRSGTAFLSFFVADRVADT
jgi:hypothetical protein